MAASSLGRSSIGEWPASSSSGSTPRTSREMPLPVRPDHGVAGADDVGRSLDGERIPLEASLPAKPGREMRMLGRVLELQRGDGRVRVVGAAELVADASVTEARHEDVRRASAADERAEEDWVRASMWGIV